MTTKLRDDRERSEKIGGMVVLFDGSSGTWRVVRSDGRVVMDGFLTYSTAQEWIDAQQSAATVMAERRCNERKQQRLALTFGVRHEPT